MAINFMIYNNFATHRLEAYSLNFIVYSLQVSV